MGLPWAGAPPSPDPSPDLSPGPLPDSLLCSAIERGPAIAIGLTLSQVSRLSANLPVPLARPMVYGPGPQGSGKIPDLLPYALY